MFRYSITRFFPENNYNRVQIARGTSNGTVTFDCGGKNNPLTPSISLRTCPLRINFSAAASVRQKYFIPDCRLASSEPAAKHGSAGRIYHITVKYKIKLLASKGPTFCGFYGCGWPAGNLPLNSMLQNPYDRRKIVTFGGAAP